MEGLKLGLIRKLAMPEEVDHFLVADLAGQFIDVVSGVDEDSLLTPHVTEGSGVGNDTFETFGNDWHENGRLGVGNENRFPIASSCG
jgi:hypothetical protein